MLLKLLLSSIILCESFTVTEASATETGRDHDTQNGSVQQEVRKFYTNLNAEEKAQLRKFAQTNAANFSLTDTQFMDGLKEEAAGLFGKLSGLRDAINDKLDTMQPESRIFIEQVLRRFLAAFSQDGLVNILAAIKGLGKDVLDMFDGLSRATQQDVLKAFPTIGSLATSDVVRLILQKIAEFDLVSKTWTPAPTVDLDVDDSGNPIPKKSRHHAPDPKPIEPAKPGGLEPEPSSGHVKKGLKTTTMYPPFGEEEPVYIKEIVDSK